MNSHKQVAVMGLIAVAEVPGISLDTARKWLRLFEQGSLEGLADRSSRPSRARFTVDEVMKRSMEQLRRLRTPMRRIAELVS